MKRVVERELLDELPKENPRAIHSRRDLQCINFFMGNVAAAERNFRKLFPETPPKQIAELGAGDGTFMLKLAQKFSRNWRNVENILVDQQDLVSDETREKFCELGCNLKVVAADVFDWLATCEPADCIFANLFLHHFEDEKLSELLRLVSMKTQNFFAIEPRRSRAGIFGTKLLGLIGCNDVTRNDAAISVRAGFCDNELSSLWPERENWRLKETNDGFFGHNFSATVAASENS